jgi:hypothetical protein
MKDLISVFAYCPDNRRKKILQDLLNQLQPIRDRFEIMVVAHSSISDISLSLVDYFYYDSNNELISDLFLTSSTIISYTIFVNFIPTDLIYILINTSVFIKLNTIRTPLSRI